MQNLTTAVLLILATLSLASCNRSPSPAVESTPSIDGGHLLLAAEPDDAQSVIAARESAQNDTEITIVGRIGGSVMPWIDGRAAFSVVDMSLHSCLVTGDNCKTPWDYCCETDRLPTGMALVKFEDDNGRLIATDARTLLGVQELDAVVIQGVAKRDDAANLTIVATGLFKRTDDAQR